MVSSHFSCGAFLLRASCTSLSQTSRPRSLKISHSSAGPTRKQSIYIWSVPHLRFARVLGCHMSLVIGVGWCMPLWRYIAPEVRHMAPHLAINCTYVGDILHPCGDVLRPCGDMFSPCVNVLHPFGDILVIYCALWQYKAPPCGDILRPCDDTLHPCGDIAMLI